MIIGGMQMQKLYADNLGLEQQVYSSAYYILVCHTQYIVDIFLQCVIDCMVPFSFKRSNFLPSISLWSWIWSSSSSGFVM